MIQKINYIPPRTTPSNEGTNSLGFDCGWILERSMGELEFESELGVELELQVVESESGRTWGESGANPLVARDAFTLSKSTTNIILSVRENNQFY